jgi:predicted extracellular nuclease
MGVVGTVVSRSPTTSLSFTTNRPRHPAPQTASCTISVSVTVPATAARIHDIQGAAHISPLNGKAVASVPGIVTAVRSNGFNLQDPQPDSNPATSEAIFVFTSTAPTVHVANQFVWRDSGSRQQRHSRSAA